MKTINIKQQQNPITIKEGFGLVGMKIELNLAQIQNLGSIHQSLLLKSNNLTPEEQDLLPFLEIFKDFSTDRNNLWNNFKKKEEVEQNNMMP